MRDMDTMQGFVDGWQPGLLADKAGRTLRKEALDWRTLRMRSVPPAVRASAPAPPRKRR